MKSESGAKGVGGAWEGGWPALGPFWKGPKAPQPLPHGPCATSLRTRFSCSALGHTRPAPAISHRANSSCVLSPAVSHRPIPSCALPQPPRESMEHRLEDGGGKVGGAGELLAGEGAAVLPEEAGDAEAVGLGELGNGQMEEAQAFRMSLGPELLVGPDLEEGTGALLVLLGDVLFPDEQEGKVPAGRAEKAVDLVQVDVAAGEQHAVGIDLPVVRQVDAGAEKGAPLLQRHVADPLRRDGGIFLEEKAAHTPRVVLRKQGITGVQRIPEHISSGSPFPTRWKWVPMTTSQYTRIWYLKASTAIRFRP